MAGSMIPARRRVAGGRRGLTKMVTLAVAAAAALVAAPEPAWAAPAETGLRHKSSLGIRPTPLGITLTSDTGHRMRLSESDSDLFRGTYVEGGLATNLSPAYLWVGPYVELLPVTVLQLRFSAQRVRYFGSYGSLLFTDPDDDRSWSRSKIESARNRDTGEEGSGWMFDLRATPRLRFGNVVAFAETSYTRILMDVDGQYYEPSFDLVFEPDDSVLITRPTLGYIFGADPAETFLMLGVRWERAQTVETAIKRDMAGIVWLWKVPSSIMELGEPMVSGFGGVYLKHPNRSRFAPYLGVQITMSF